MKRIQIAPGIEMTDIAMGESRRGYPDCEQSAFEVMDRYVELGGNTFDSARLYSDGAADRALGKWIKSRGLRDSLTVVTKGSHPDRKNMFASRLARRLKTAETLGVSPAAVATAYVRDRGLNAVVLSSFSSRKQLEEAWEAETFRLTRAQLRYLETGVGAC